MEQLGKVSTTSVMMTSWMDLMSPAMEAIWEEATVAQSLVDAAGIDGPTHKCEVRDISVMGHETKDVGSVAKRPAASRRIGTRRMRLARGLTVDSGAADNVMPRRMVRGKFNRIRPSPGSRMGVHYLSASSARIKNEGEADFHFITDGGHTEKYVFQIAEVNKALCAVSYLVDNDNRVTFDRDPKTGVDTSHVLNKKTGTITRLRRERNVWTIDAYIDEEVEPEPEAGFVRQG